MTRILAINGSYRDDGVTDRVLEAIVAELADAGAEVEVVRLREHPIEFCLNCRQCTQKPGEDPAQCIQHDDMRDLIDKIEQADAYVLASPTNFGSVTALFKRFMERLMVYAYWPWDQPAPKMRRQNAARKSAIVVSSCAAPGLLGRLIYTSHRQLKQTANTIGADTVGSLFTGHAATRFGTDLPIEVVERARELAHKLL
jgi:multimeric flavodoxin WrbA